MLEALFLILNKRTLFNLKYTMLTTRDRIFILK